MEPFEYIAAIYSIVIALAAANLLAALGETLKYRKTVNHYWLHTAWCVMWLVGLLAVWVSVWDVLSGIENMTFLEMLPYFQFVVIYYLATWLLKPSLFTPELDLRSYFYSIRTPFLLCLLIPSVVLVPWIIIRFDEPMDAAMFTVFGQWIALVGGLLSSRHSVQVAVFFIFWTLQVVQEFYQSGIG